MNKVFLESNFKFESVFDKVEITTEANFKTNVLNVRFAIVRC